jgi:hypothetical protein
VADRHATPWTRHLEAWVVGTAATVLLVVGAILGSHLDGSLPVALPAVGTAAATFLFGYLWLLAVVAAGAVIPPTPDTAGPTAWLGRTAAGGAAVALIYLTIVLVVGFVSPLPTPIDPGFRSVFGAVAAGTVAGAVLGPTAGIVFAICRRVAAVAVRDAET